MQRIVVNRRSGRILDGHARVEEAARRGEPQVPVVYVDLTDEEEALVLASFDPIGALADADPTALTSLLADVETADRAVQTLLAGLTPESEAPLPPDPGPSPLAPTTVTHPGDTWQLGGHRLRCGDATRAADVDALIEGEEAEWMWTDPPYGVEYGGGSGAALPIANDTIAALPDLLRGAFTRASPVLQRGAPAYLVSPAGPNAAIFLAAFVEAGWHLHQTLIWVKDTFVLGHADHHYRHEPILYGWTPGPRPWFGGRTVDSVFEFPRPKRSLDHPTGKPVALVEAQLRNSSWRGSLGYDPFAGSGTTLIAAERLGRRCAALEIEPRYVDVIVRRWQALTGEAATLSGNGRSFRAIEEARDGR